MEDFAKEPILRFNDEEEAESFETAAKVAIAVANAFAGIIRERTFNGLTGKEVVKKTGRGELPVKIEGKSAIISDPSLLVSIMEAASFILDNVKDLIGVDKGLIKAIEIYLLLVKAAAGVPEIDGNRLYYPMIELLVEEFAGEPFVIERNLPEKAVEILEGECSPKVGEEWVLEELIPADPHGPEERQDRIVLLKNDCKILVTAWEFFIATDLKENLKG